MSSTTGAPSAHGQTRPGGCMNHALSSRHVMAWYGMASSGDVAAAASNGNFHTRRLHDVADRDGFTDHLGQVDRPAARNALARQGSATFSQPITLDTKWTASSSHNSRPPIMECSTITLSNAKPEFSGPVHGHPITRESQRRHSHCQSSPSLASGVVAGQHRPHHRLHDRVPSAG